ncbi:AAA family ATPase [Actinoplanes sp. KI2]|uniref:AAA family ATPase n=1 Tax=Actinoplanes sp. KI2 TaxID=2983315 RepID=UPI0021D59EA9|nr:AAA family ATPase [Actinoplanes sp. KI2]MCU7728854.1 AAA family ATPase [Actinoplanes sp. KI2]
MTTAPLLPGFPAFVNELAGTLAVHSQFVLHGNLRDLFLMEPPGRPARPVAMLPLLWAALAPRGYSCLVCYDPVDGVTVFPPQPVPIEAAQRLLGNRVIGRRPSLERLRVHLAKVVGVAEQPPPEGGTAGPGPGEPTPDPRQPGPRHQAAAPAKRDPTVRPPVRAAVVIDYAARITRVPGQLDPAERDFFLYCQKLAFTAEPFETGQVPGERYNPIIWLTEGERDLPAWLTSGAEPIRTIAVGMPTLGERERLAEVVVPMLPPARNPGGAAPAAEFAKLTEGMTLRAMTEVVRLSRDRGLGAGQIPDAVRAYKFGVTDNPWRHDSVKKHITDGERVIANRIIGQPRATGKTLDILKRAALGLSGAQATSTVSRPRGVLFFAGPTGVGKTEMAKQIAELLFGDVNAYLRFDMSEFAADHAAERLTGAPPGYVGFEAGGELTGAVRRNPFQVVLFDEIEKANKSVLDKFLQILEDGRLTDGQGITTYFSECVLIFTSNLGIITTDKTTGERVQQVQPGMPYPDLEATVKAAVREHFTVTLERPELLNRLGDNIVVFNFIDRDSADQIFRLQLTNIVRTVERELQMSLSLTDQARDQLRAACTIDTPNGGRGIGNLLESNLINPLARKLFDLDAPPGSTVEITAAYPGTATAGPRIEARVTAAGRAL